MLKRFWSYMNERVGEPPSWGGLFFWIFMLSVISVVGICIGAVADYLEALPLFQSMDYTRKMAEGAALLISAGVGYAVYLVIGTAIAAYPFFKRRR